MFSFVSDFLGKKIGGLAMKRIITIVLILSFIALVAIPVPANAGGGNGWAIGGAILGGLLLGSVLNNHGRIVVGPAHPHYPPPVYYPSPVYPSPVYEPQPVWIPDYYVLRPVVTCQQYRYPYPYQNCFRHHITVLVPGHWEHR